MDITQRAALRLREQGESIKSISRRLKISEQKVRRILITVGAYSTPTSRRIQAKLRTGKTIEEIAQELDITAKSAIQNLPYSKGAYNKEYPSKNALAIRRCRNKKIGDAGVKNEDEQN